jgi:HK97 family phage portal protein
MMLTKVFGAFSNPAEWLVNYFNGWSDEARHKQITSVSALSYAPIWYGVNKIAGHIGQLPVGVYRRLDRGAERDRRHNVHRLMRRPNMFQTSILFREMLATHSLLDGNGRAAIVRDKTTGRISELLPMMPSETSTVMWEGKKIHACRPSEHDRLRVFFKPDSKERPSERGLLLFEDSEVFHVPGLSFDGVQGLPLRELARRNLSASINAEERLANQMENGFSGSLMLQAPQGVFRKQEDAEEFLEAFESRHNSAKNSGKVGMLREGITANVVAMNNKDAEMTESRKFQRQDAALWLGLEQILGDDTSVSYNSLEQKNLAYLMNCLNKWLKRWEEEMEYKLLPKRQFESESHFVRFNTAALLKSDYKTSVESLAMGIASTIFSPNEAREKLDMNPYEGGDVHINPNTTSSTQSESQPDTEESDVTTKARLAIYSRLSHLIGVEANRVKSGAKTAKDFGRWLDNFYTKKWEPQLADELESMGIDRELSTVHCQESRRRIQQAIDAMPYDAELTAVIADCVSNWKSRAATIGELQNV